TGALGRVSDVIAADNDADGFNVAGTGFTVTSCEATHNGRDGFALRGLRYRVEGNRATENGRYGFSLAGREAALGGALGNEATGNRRDGLVVRGRSHNLAHPVATANGAGGIRARLAGGRVRGAVAIGNRGAGVRATAHDVTISGSEAHDNGRGGLDVRGSRGRDVTLSGQLNVGEHAVAITAGSLHVTGRLSATGSQGIIRVQPPPGGTLGRTGVPGLNLTDRGRIDLSGINGATLIVVADGAVELSGGQGSLVNADANDTGGAGGTIDITSRGESITIGMPLSLKGGQEGIGGTLRLPAARDLTFTPSATPVSVAAGFEAGSLELDGGQTVALQLGSKLESTGLPLTGGSGGSIDIAGGTIDANGALDAS